MCDRGRRKLGSWPCSGSGFSLRTLLAIYLFLLCCMLASLFVPVSWEAVGNLSWTGIEGCDEGARLENVTAGGLMVVSSFEERVGL